MSCPRHRRPSAPLSVELRARHARRIVRIAGVVLPLMVFAMTDLHVLAAQSSSYTLQTMFPSEFSTTMGESASYRLTEGGTDWRTGRLVSNGYELRGATAPSGGATGGSTGGTGGTGGTSGGSGGGTTGGGGGGGGGGRPRPSDSIDEPSVPDTPEQPTAPEPSKPDLPKLDLPKPSAPVDGVDVAPLPGSTDVVSVPLPGSLHPATPTVDPATGVTALMEEVAPLYRASGCLSGHASTCAVSLEAAVLTRLVFVYHAEALLEAVPAFASLEASALPLAGAGTGSAGSGLLAPVLGILRRKRRTDADAGDSSAIA